MKIGFKDFTPQASIKAIEEQLSGRNLGTMVSFELEEESLAVIISKLGTSRLLFSVMFNDGNTIFELEKEKIAFAHRAMKHNVITKLSKVIKKCGGELIKEYGAS